MARLNKRVQVLFSLAQYARLRQIARSRGAAVSSLVREAVQKEYLDTHREKLTAAVEEMAALRLPVSDTQQMERESVE